MGALNGVPPDVQLNELARAVFEVMQRYTAFPWPIFSTQCKRAGVEPGTLTPAELTKIIPALGAGVARFTTPAQEALVRRELQKLAGG